MAGYALMTANGYAGWGLETVRGTAASVTTFTPVGEPKVEPKITWLDDSALRGSPTMHYDQVPGVRHDEYAVKEFWYWDQSPNRIRAALGSTDSVAASVHTIGLANVPQTGSQPPSYTIINDSVDNTYQLTSAQLADFTLTLGADAAVELASTWITNPYTIAASVNAVETAAHLAPAWNCSASIGGTAVTIIENFELEIKRNSAAIHTLGNQGPYRNWAGPVDVMGKLTLVVEYGTNYNAQALTRNQQLLQLQVTDPVTNYYSYFQMSAAQLENPVITVGKAYLTLESAFTAVANTTDAVNGGYSPILTKTYNNVASY